VCVPLARTETIRHRERGPQTITDRGSSLDRGLKSGTIDASMPSLDQERDRGWGGLCRSCARVLYDGKT